ncbi:hypothetical protein LTR12_001990 [Friedmanniomyces endolithicus]|nr:hypothetical protein LTR12_001990 [Friedmanniomyces endolithicus]
MSLPPAATASADAVAQPKELADSLRTDRMINIYVGKATPEAKPFRVQQVLLEQLSEYFSNALSADTFVEGKKARLNFPEDDVDAWKVLLRWAFTHTVPHWTKKMAGKIEMVFVDCWVLGDKYQIRSFQNEVMMEMLYYYTCNSGSFEVLRHGVEQTSSGSKLRRLMAEEVVAGVDVGKQGFDLDQFDGMRFLKDYVQAKQRLSGHEWCSRGYAAATRFGGNCDATINAGPGGTWKEYMVGDKLPHRAWKWDITSKAWAA